MTDINRLAYYVANSGLLRQNYDANNLARSCQCVYELTGFKALNLASQINQLLANQRSHRNIRRRPRRMPESDMEHTPFSLTLFYGSM